MAYMVDNISSTMVCTGLALVVSPLTNVLIYIEDLQHLLSTSRSAALSGLQLSYCALNKVMIRAAELLYGYGKYLMTLYLCCQNFTPNLNMYSIKTEEDF